MHGQVRANRMAAVNTAGDDDYEDRVNLYNRVTNTRQVGGVRQQVLKRRSAISARQMLLVALTQIESSRS